MVTNPMAFADGLTCSEISCNWIRVRAEKQENERASVQQQSRGMLKSHRLLKLPPPQAMKQQISDTGLLEDSRPLALLYLLDVFANESSGLRCQTGVIPVPSPPRVPFHTSDIPELFLYV